MFNWLNTVVLHYSSHINLRSADTNVKLQFPSLTTFLISDNNTNRLPNIKTEPLESLTENELIYLVKGFKSLDKEDQHELINYMKKLERSDPAMVQRVKIGMQRPWKFWLRAWSCKVWFHEKKIMFVNIYQDGIWLDNVLEMRLCMRRCQIEVQFESGGASKTKVAFWD